MSVFSELAADYPLLYLNPDTDSRDTYRRVVLRGEAPEKHSLDHYHGSEADRLDLADTPAGRVRVATIGDRRDFELLVRGLMAAKDGPLAPVLESQGAAMIYVFNWRHINEHLAAFPEAEQAEEFRRFTAEKENYLDMLVVLSRGPYSHVDAAEAGFAGDEWLVLSDTIRRFHELTHVVCRRQYPDDKDPIRDELIADAVGLFAAFGQFDPELEKRFLGIGNGHYTGGRLAVYTGDPESMAAPVCETLGLIRELTGTQKPADPFGLIPVLMREIKPFSAPVPH